MAKWTTVIFINGTAIDGGMVPRPVRVTHGRSGTDAQPDAPTAEFDYIGPIAPAEVGDECWIGTQGGAAPEGWNSPSVEWADPEFTWMGLPVGSGKSARAGLNSDRFRGTITQAHAVEKNGEVVSWSMVATGYQAKLGRIPILTERPIETDIDRVNAIAAIAGVPVNIMGTASLTLAIDAIDRTALAALQEVCKATGGLLWQARDGSIWYGTSNHRETATSAILPAQSILDGVEWDKDSSTIINSIKVVYPAPRLPPASPTGNWNYTTSSDTGTNPGTGNIVSNDTPTTSTTLAISRYRSGGNDMHSALKRLNTGSSIFMANPTNVDQWIRYGVLDAATDNGGWFQINVDFKEYGPAHEPAKGTTVVLTADPRHQEEVNSVTMKDDASIAQWGTLHTETETIVSDANQGAILAATILKRRAQPFWAMPGVLVPYEELSDGDYGTMQMLEVSTGILVPVLLDPAPTPAPVTEWAVEGWVEEWREDGYWCQLSLSDWSRTTTVRVRDWQEMRDTMNWTAASAKNWRTLIVEA